ncbi:MAG: TIGR04219 family outer membrane beta-barrel protein [Halioglobus sp.]
MPLLFRFCLLVLLFSYSSHLRADVLGGKVGVNVWSQEFEGNGRNGGNNIDFDSTFDIDDETDYQVFAALEHPVPLIPNILVQHTRMELSGDGDIGAELFDGVVLTGDVQTDLDLTHTDVTAYYEILDNWVNLDLGLSVRFMDASASLLDENGQSGEVKTDDAIPMGYAALRLDLPFTGWYVQADGNYVSWDGDDYSDLRAAVGWEIALGLGLELGYRTMDIDYSGGSDKLKAETSGVYGGIFWDF